MIGRNSPPRPRLRLHFTPVLAICVALLAATGLAQTPNPCNPQPLTDDYVLPLPQGQQIVFRKVYLRKGSEPDSHSESRRCVGNGFDFTVRGNFQDEAGGRWYYLMGKYEVTERQWVAIMSDGKSSVPASDLDLPKRNVTKADALQFLNGIMVWLIQQKDSDFKHTYPYARLRLPGEAEWQFAARGGAEVTPEVFEQPYPYAEAELGDHEWFRGQDSADGQARAVGLKKPNALGLHDMIGNVREWLEGDYESADGRIGGSAAMGGSYKTNKGNMGVQKSEVYSVAESDIGFRVVLGSLVITEVKPAANPPPEPVNPSPSPTATGIARSVSPAPRNPPPEAVNPSPSPSATVLARSPSPGPPVARYANPHPEPMTPVPSPTPPAHAPSPAPPGSEYTNSLGMQFLPVKGLTVRFSVVRTRRQDFQAFVDALRNDEHLQKDLQTNVPTAWEKPMINGKPIGVTPDYPVVKVSWKEANAFCRWLSRSENRRYRLPTADEWWRARVEGGIYPWGDDKAAPAHALDERLMTVMIWKNHITALYDMGTNVQEWSGTVLSDFAGETERKAILLGHGWRIHIDDERAFLYSFLLPPKPTDAESIDSLRQPDIGFRCVLEP